MTFANRAAAAEKLCERLVQYRGKNPLVLAIPRGAVPMARIIADSLGGELDVVLVRKLRAPDNPELAIGAIDETGWSFIAPYAASTGADAPYLAREKAFQLALMGERRQRYTPVRSPIDPQGRIVIVVDDGLATGSTMIAALHASRVKEPARLICAIPVAPLETLDRVAPYADEVVCLETPEWFHAVAQFYEEFPQVDDQEVIATLKAQPAEAQTAAQH